MQSYTVPGITDKFEQFGELTTFNLAVILDESKFEIDGTLILTVIEVFELTWLSITGVAGTGIEVLLSGIKIVAKEDTEPTSFATNTTHAR